MENGGYTFSVWAPLKERMFLHLVHPRKMVVEMTRDEKGLFSVTLEEAVPGTRYLYAPDGDRTLPDPRSHYQPEGVHGPSQVVDHTSFKWSDQHWHGVPLKDLVLYELHVGTFTPEGTFAAIIPKLDHLADLGINAIELMPVCQFPGERNWGYDATYPYAVQNSYGGPEGLYGLVNACHAKGIAVLLDLVYNHLGPEGNYLDRSGPYFNDRYRTPWGDAINFDSDWSDGVREYFSDNLLHWIENYHIDGFRMDAIHMVFDNGAIHFWELCHNKVKDAEQRLGRKVHMIAESDQNTPRVTKLPEVGGYGFDAQWLDDLHHALYVILDERGKERYADYGSMEQLAKAFKDGFVLSGEYVEFRKRKHGRSSAGEPGEKFVVFNQNHDQIGNRVRGERSSLLMDPERLKLAAAAIFLSPYLPMLFMGEEFASTSPFFYFVHHSDKELIEAVREGRKKEFEKFNWDVEPPDPQAEETFQRSKVRWEEMDGGLNRMMLSWHRKLIELRRTCPILKNHNKNDTDATVIGREGLVLTRRDHDGKDHLLCIFNFAGIPIEHTFAAQGAQWHKILDSREREWMLATQPPDPLPATVADAEKLRIPPLSMVVYRSARNNSSL